MHKYLILLLALLSQFAFAEQMNEQRSVEEYQAIYKAKWHSLVESLEQRTDLSFVQKLATYEQEVNKLKKQYSQERMGDYNDNEVTLSVEHACKGRPSGSTKNCGYRCVERPNKDMYTKPEWVSFSGDYMKEIINEEKACFKLEAKGNTQKEGTVTATFKYRNSFVEYKTVDDATELFDSFTRDHSL
jgi:hypothetical protein